MAALGCIQMNGILHLRPRQLRVLERRPHLDPLHGLHAQHGRRQAGFQPSIPLCIAAQADRYTQRNDFQYTAECIFGVHDLFDARTHLPGCGRIRAAHIVLLGQRQPLGKSDLIHLRRYITNRRHVATHHDAELRQELFAHSADGHTRRRLPRRRALQGRAQIGQPVLHRAGQVGVPGTRCCHGFHGLAAPLRMVVVGHLQRQRRAGCLPAHHTAQDHHVILLELHARPGSKTHLAPQEFTVDHRRIQRQPGRKAVQNGRQRRAVRFSGSHKT